MRTPKKIDFNLLKQEAETQIGELEKLIEETQNEIKELSAKEELTADERKFLNFIKNEVIEHGKSLRAKKMLYDEYLICSQEQEILDQRERIECRKNFKFVYRQALKLKKDFDILPALRAHLSKVLKEYKDSFSPEEKTLYYMSLKREVKICTEYKKNTVKR